MKYSKSFMTALALLPLATFTSGEAEARSQHSGNNVCREYSKTIRINGQVEIGYGTACRRDDNTWEIVSLNGVNSVQNVVEERIYDDLYSDGFRVVIYDRDYRNYRPVYRNAYRNKYRNAYYYPKNYGKSKKQYQNNSKHRH